MLSWCRQHDIDRVLASLAWQPVNESIARCFGFTTHGGPRVHISGTIYDGTIAERFDEYDKHDRALRLATTHSVPLSPCCAIGDSRTDVPLSKAVPTSLTLNAGTLVREGATATINTQDFSEIRPWLEQCEREFD